MKISTMLLHSIIEMKMILFLFEEHFGKLRIVLATKKHRKREAATLLILSLFNIFNTKLI